MTQAPTRYQTEPQVSRNLIALDPGMNGAIAILNNGNQIRSLLSHCRENSGLSADG